MYYQYIDSPIGILTIAEEEAQLRYLLFDRQSLVGEESSTPLLEETKQQLREYFRGERREFSLPLDPQGTPFQRLAWAGLQSIPYGETISYGQLAARIGHPKSFRAVGGANHRNPIAIIIPCHRVIGADGSLTGYGGGLEKKIFLLKLEQAEGFREK